MDVFLTTLHITSQNREPPPPPPSCVTLCMNDPKELLNILKAYYTLHAFLCFRVFASIFYCLPWLQNDAKTQKLIFFSNQGKYYKKMRKRLNRKKDL